MPYHRASTLEGHAAALGHSLEALSETKAAGLSFYEEDGSLVYLSYGQLRSHAQQLAGRLKQAVNVSATPRLLVDPDLPRCDLLVAFWGCIYAEICPCFLGCIAAFRSQQALEMLGSPPLLFNSQKSRSRLPGLDLADLPASAATAETSSPSPLAPTTTAFQVVAENDESELVLYSYSHDSIWANSMGMKQIFSVNQTSLKSLSWMPISPFTLLWHCAAVFHAASEIHVDLRGLRGLGLGGSQQGPCDPCSSMAPWHFLRCLRRHAGELLVAAPLIFYRRMLGRPFHSFGKVRWLLLSKDDWQMDDLRSLLSHREEQKQDLEFHQLLVAPWGAALAHAPLGSNLFASPLPGVELRQWPLMARGLQALPGAAASFGWRSLGGAAQREQLRISGVEYSSAEVETALELSPLVCPGSTVACSAGSGGGLVIFFVPKDGTISARDALVKSLAAHLALALGLHVERWVPLPAAALPRSVEGTPRREVLKGWLHGVQDTAADAPLPADWVFEEDFKAQALTSTVEVDEDAIEERMEGAALDPDVHSPKQLLLIIAGSSVSDLSAQILRAAGDGTGGYTQCRTVDSTEAAVAVMQTLEGLELMVLHLLQCEDSDGTKEVVSVIQLLQTWERKHSTLNLKVPALKLLCVSTGRHMRVAGDAMDPRKHFLSGVLLSAALELPWLQVCQLDACPKLRQATLAEQLLQEIGSELPSSEVLLDADGARLLRRLRPAALAPQHRLQLLKQCRSILLAGGLGGIGSLWAQHLGAEQLLLLGRRPRSAASPQLEELRRGNSEIVYISADICKKQQLRSALQNCPAMKFLDFAACLCESFEPPQSVLQLDALTAMNGPQEKLRGAENFIEVLKDLTSTTPFRRVPVLFASSAVSVTGAPQLGVYSAKARGLEALCMKETAASARRKMLEIGCVALSAWDHVGITAAFPALASNAPALGLKTLTPQQGLEALEAVLRFQAPRFAVLMVGVDGQHPRVQALTGGSSSAATSTATVSGCVEMIQAAVRKVLGKEANLGDSFVELGLDSMSSMSLHSSLSDVSGVVLPLSLFYDEPSLLDAAKYLHRAAGAAGSGSGDEENLEALLQDDEARRSYHLSQGRSAMNAKDFHLAREKCRAASLGAVGHALIAALSLEAEACHALGDAAASGELLRRVLRTEEELHGAESADCCLALAKLIHLGEQSASHCHDFQRHHRRFLQTVAWVPSATSRSDVAPVEPAWEMRRLRWVNLDLQQLDGFSKDDLGALSGLEVLEVMTMRRNGLTELPGSFGQLQTLRELYLTGNCLSDLPESFCNLSKLQVLCLERNRLVTLPSAVYAISKRLLQLGLDEQEVPFSLDEQLLIPKLSILRARGCQAATFPKMLLGSKGLPSNLNTIFWANNGLLKLPDLRDASVAEALRSLRLLDLAHNQITSMDALTMADCSLRHLRDLSLAGNRLTEIPAAIAQALPALQQLWLHGNQLKKLPEQLGELQSLAILELHHNRLRELPQSMGKLQKLNWFFAHGNELTDVHIIKTLNTLPRLKIVGLGCNQIPLQQIDFHSLHASYGLGWNLGIAAADEVLTEALTTTDLHWDRLVSDEVQQLLVITFSAQGAPVAQGQAEVRALRDAMLKVDALYVCDPANAWFLQDPTFQWKGLEYFEQKISSITSKYRRVFAWGGSMGGSASLLFAHLVDRVHAFSPQVDLAFTWPTFGTEEVRQQFRRQVQDSVRRCRGRGGEVHLHVGAENHTDNRHAAALTHAVVHLHETANHNTMKHVKQRGKLLPLLKFEVMDFLIQ